jgi:hypothetical protein
MGAKKNFVIDTNVILHDYNCLKNFQENDIYLPIVVLEELDKLTGIEIYLLVSFFELIQFFEYNKREVNIIFLKILQAIVVVKNNICV